MGEECNIDYYVFVDFVCGEIVFVNLFMDGFVVFFYVNLVCEVLLW